MSDFWRIAIFVAVGSLAACSQTSETSINATSAFAQRDTAPNAVADGQQHVAALTADAPDTGSAPPSSDYRISPTDVIEITVFQVPDLSKTVEVSASGQIVLPLIGPVVAAGKSATELEAEIAAKLSERYLQNPDVAVFIKNAVSQRITVEGAVSKPGIYATTGTATLLQVVALAGGLDRIADERGIVVFRSVDGKRHAAKFDYKAIRAGAADDPVLVGGDVVVVDESGMKAAMRSVRETIGFFNLFTPLI